MNSASLSTRSRRATRGAAVVGRGSVVVMPRAFPALRATTCVPDVNRAVGSVPCEQEGGMADDDLSIPAPVAEAMQDELPAVAEQTVAAIVVEGPSYADAFSGEMGRTIENAVQLALGGFLVLAAARGEGDASTPIQPALDGAYALGRGEARSGRSMDALLGAYRVGARVSWRHMADSGVRAGLSAEQLAHFAELVFAYIDQLSAASVAGHSDELATSGRVRERYLERLANQLLRGGPREDLLAATERADWATPRTLTAVILPEARVRGALASLDPRTLRSTEDVPG